MTQEAIRLQEARDRKSNWREWGPYLSERQWGTVREDYSEQETRGSTFPMTRPAPERTAGAKMALPAYPTISRDCVLLSLCGMEKMPILKERLFGLTNSEGNHGEDVKEYYFYIDSTPTHSYMKYLYKYPQRAFPYDELVKTNRQRSRNEMEYELLDTGIFNDDRYFDVFVEYAKEAPQDLLTKITIWNRGPEAASIHVLPTLWFRNTWAGLILRTGRL